MGLHCRFYAFPLKVGRGMVVLIVSSHAEPERLQVHFLLHPLCLPLPLLLASALLHGLRCRYVYRREPSHLQQVVFGDRPDTTHILHYLKMDLLHLHYPVVSQPGLRAHSSPPNHETGKRR